MRLSRLEGLFHDTAGLRRLVVRDDPVVYRVEEPGSHERGAALGLAETTISPGAVAGEFFMTRGHMHELPRDEVYVGLAGAGVVLLYDGVRTAAHEIEPGIAVHIPAGCAHRTVNVGDAPLRFLAVYHRDSGANYEWVQERGMGARVVVGDGEPYRVVPDADGAAG